MRSTSDDVLVEGTEDDVGDDAGTGFVVAAAVQELFCDAGDAAMLLARDGSIRWANDACWRLIGDPGVRAPGGLLDALDGMARDAVLTALRTLPTPGTRRVPLPFGPPALELVLALRTLSPLPPGIAVGRIEQARSLFEIAERAERLDAALRRVRSELRALHRADEPAAPQAVVPVPLPSDVPERQRDVAALLLEGLPAETIAKKLGLSPNTVRNHIKALFRRTDVHSRAEFVARYYI